MSIRRAAVVISVLAVLVLTSAAPAEAATPSMRPGNWELTFQVDIPGLPVKMKPITVAKCVTEEDAADPNKSLPSQSSDDKCKVIDHKIDGAKVTWAVKCEGQQEVSAKGEMTVADDSFDGVIRAMSQGQELSTKIKGKRLGDCKK